MANLTQRFGRNLKKIREKKGMSQFDLAQKAGLDITTINELENGRRQPLLKTTWKIANALKIKAENLLV